jgi:polyhydroxybutyrate depolymerase
MNPWAGGDVALYGLIGNRGAVLSTEQSIDYFRELAGHTGAAEVSTLSDREPNDGSTVELRRWSTPGKKPVVLYAIRNGGHNAPHPKLTLPRLLGPTNHDISAAEEIWRFFSEAP